MSLNRLRYPVLRVNIHNIRIFDSSNLVTMIGDTDVNYWKNLPQTFIFDSTGAKLQIKGMQKFRRSWHPCTWTARAPSLRVTWLIEELPGVTLEELRTSLTEMIVAKRWYTQSWENEAKFRKRILEPKSFESLFNAANFYGRWIG